MCSNESQSFNDSLCSNEIDDDDVDDVQMEMEGLLSAHPIVKESLRKIKGTNTYANSLNVFVGRQRSGKSFQAIQEIIKISRIDPTAHLLVYVNQKGSCDDDTFETFKEMIEIPIEYVRYDNVE